MCVFFFLFVFFSFARVFEFLPPPTAAVRERFSDRAERLSGRQARGRGAAESPGLSVRTGRQAGVELLELLHVWSSHTLYYLSLWGYLNNLDVSFNCGSFYIFLNILFT